MEARRRKSFGTIINTWQTLIGIFEKNQLQDDVSKANYKRSYMTNERSRRMTPTNGK